jgi:hypothetical protein
MGLPMFVRAKRLALVFGDACQRIDVEHVLKHVLEYCKSSCESLTALEVKFRCKYHRVECDACKLGKIEQTFNKFFHVYLYKKKVINKNSIKFIF